MMNADTFPDPSAELELSVAEPNIKYRAAGRIRQKTSVSGLIRRAVKECQL
jgi:hypothetical protein